MIGLAATGKFNLVCNVHTWNEISDRKCKVSSKHLAFHKLFKYYS